MVVGCSRDGSVLFVASQKHRQRAHLMGVLLLLLFL